MEKPIVWNATKCPESIVEKGWGYEVHIENNEDYCAKLLVFEKGKKFSMHYHVDKHETWFVREGKLKFTWIDPANADRVVQELKPGDVVTIHQGIAHQLEALETSCIFETSTHDKIEDSYRVEKGDSQK
jgi:mannose-6-phosphate isomerase-like protein (cupin superfamily)